MWPFDIEDDSEEDDSSSSSDEDVQMEVVDVVEDERPPSPTSRRYLTEYARRFIPTMSTNIRLQDGVPGAEIKPIDILLAKDFQQLAAVQRTTAVRPLRCECSEVVAIRTAAELRDIRVLRPPMDEVLRASLPNSDNYLPCESNKSRKSFNNDDSLISESSLVRRRRHFGEGMPPPNLFALQVANRVIKYARCAKSIHEEAMYCLNCGLIPDRPVTGKCGHSRCMKCVEMDNICPCGEEILEPFYENVLIKNLIMNKTAEGSFSKNVVVASVPKIAASPVNMLLNGECESSFGPIHTRTKRTPRPSILASASGRNKQSIPMSARARFSYALDLLKSGKYRDAVPQLALAAASNHADLRVARPLLAQVITVISNNTDPRALTRELNYLVRQLTSMSWLKLKDMECVLCCDVFTNAVTTPCGHMFCRICLEKTLDYRRRCPLCLRSLGDFQLNETNDTVFMREALSALNHVPVPKPIAGDDLIPIFVCTVAYPSVPCPLFIFDPRYWMMIRRVLVTGSRRFGMVAMDREKKYVDYGTILEVRDCVLFEDGRSILSTVGLSRFKVIERSVQDGYEVARIQPIHDLPLSESVTITQAKGFAARVMFKAIFWLTTLSDSVLADIRNTFGDLPKVHELDNAEDWWDTTDGPAWLWWLVAVLPLRIEIKVLILSTECLIKRMMAVGRTLDAVERVTLTTLTAGQYEVRVNMPNHNELLDG